MCSEAKPSKLLAVRLNALLVALCCNCPNNQVHYVFFRLRWSQKAPRRNRATCRDFEPITQKQVKRTAQILFSNAKLI